MDANLKYKYERRIFRRIFCRYSRTKSWQKIIWQIKSHEKSAQTRLGAVEKNQTKKQTVIFDDCL